MKRLRRLIVLGIIAGWGASRLMGSRGYGARERVRGKAEQLKGRFEQVVSGGGSNYTNIMDDAGKLLLTAVQKETPVGPDTPTRQGGTLRSSLYYVNG